MLRHIGDESHTNSTNDPLYLLLAEGPFLKLLLVSSLKLVKCLTKKIFCLKTICHQSAADLIELQHNSGHYEAVEAHPFPVSISQENFFRS